MPTRKDRVDADVGIAEFPSRRLDQAQGSGFTSRIGCLARSTQGAAQGTHDGDGTSTSFGKKPQPSLKTQKQAGEVGVHHLFPLGWRDADGEAIDGCAH